MLVGVTAPATLSWSVCPTSSVGAAGVIVVELPCTRSVSKSATTANTDNFSVRANTFMTLSFNCSAEAVVRLRMWPRRPGRQTDDGRRRLGEQLFVHRAIPANHLR